ncbi:MAG: hypothetical protein ACJAZ1_002513 [Yoonia sp.]|jgi:hypothetical protein
MGLRMAANPYLKSASAFEVVVSKVDELRRADNNEPVIAI